MNSTNPTRRKRRFPVRLAMNSRASRRRLRRLLVESLEDRRLLALDTDAWKGLKDGLTNNLLPYVDTIENQGAYAQVLPVVGRAVNTIAPLHELINQALVQPTLQQISQHPTANFAAFISRLNSQTGILPSGYQIVTTHAIGADAGVEAFVDWSIALRKTESPQLLAYAESLDTALTVLPFSGLSQTTDVTFTFTFGVNLITKEFFIKDAAAEEVKVQTRLNVSGVNPVVPSNQVRPGVDGRIGGIATKLDVSLDSLVQTNYSLTDNWDNSLAASAYWNPSQFDQAAANTATFQIVTLNGKGNLLTEVTPVLLTPLNNVKRAFSMQTTLSDGIVNQTSSGGSFADFAAVRNFSPDAISSGIGVVAELISRTASDSHYGQNPFRQTLAPLGQTWNDLIDIRALLNETLVDPTRIEFDPQTNQITRNPVHSDAEILSVLNSFPSNHATLTFSPTEAVFDLTINKPKTFSALIKPGLGDDLDLPLDSTATFTVNTLTHLKFGVRLSDGLFILKTDAGPTFQITANSTVPISAQNGTRLGFTRIDVNSGSSVTLESSATLRLIDNGLDERLSPPPNVAAIYGPDRRPSSLGSLTASEMIGESQMETIGGQIVESPVPNNLDTTSILSDPNVGTTATLTLNISGTLPGLAPQSGNLTLNWPNAYQANIASQSIAPTIAGLYKFNSIKPDDFVRTGLSGISGVTSQLVSGAGLGTSLPLVGNSLSGLIPLNTILSNAIGQLGDDATLAKLTIQDIVARLGVSLGQSVDVQINADDVRLRLPVVIGNSTKQIPISVARKLVDTGGFGDVGFEATGNVNVILSASAAIVVGMSFDSAIPPVQRAINNRFFVAANNAANNNSFSSSSGQVQFSLSTGQNPIAANINLGLGRLTGSLAANLSNGAVPASVVVPLRDLASSNDGRLTLAELQSDVRAGVGSPMASGSATATATLPTRNGQNASINVSWNLLNPTAATVDPVNLSAYILDLANFSPVGVQQGLDAILGMFQSWLSSSALKENIPALNSSLSDLLSAPINSLNTFFRNIKGANPTSPSAFLAAVRANNFLPYLNVSQIGGANSMRYSVSLNYDQTLTQNADFGSQGGLSFLKIVKSLNPRIQAMFDFEFGYDSQSGFYINSRTGNVGKEFFLSVSMGSHLDKTQGTLGPIAIGAIGDVNINAHVDLDLIDPNSDGRITTTEMRQSLAKVLGLSYDGGADLNFAFGGRLGAEGPGISSTVEAHWSLKNPTVITFGNQGSTHPEDAFTAPNYYLGEFIEKIIGPVFRKVQEYNPVPKEVTDFLNKELPIINVTPWKLLTAGADLPQGADLIFRIATAINSLPSNQPTLNLNRFISTEPVPGNGGDGNTSGGDQTGGLLSYLNGLEKDYGLSLPFLKAPKDSIIQLLVGSNVDIVKWRMPKALELTKSISGTPIFLGQYGPVTVILNYGGEFGLKGRFGFGLDSSGLRSGNFLDGFYFDDNFDKSASGKLTDNNEVEVSGGIFVRADASLIGLAGISIKGGITATLGVDLSDLRNGPTADSPKRLSRACDANQPQDSPGAVHLNELAQIADQFGASNVVNINGGVSIDVSVEVFVLFWRATVLSEKFPILKFGHGCSSAPTSRNVDFTILGRVDENNHFTQDTLNVYAWNFNDPSNFIADDDDGTDLEINLIRNTNQVPIGVRLVRTRNDERQFWNYSLQDLAPVRNLSVAASRGNDTITIDPELTSVLNIQTIYVDAGAGDDYVDLFQRSSIALNNVTYYSNLQSTLILGKGGNDQLRGTFAPDKIVGGSGIDIIDGRDGLNVLYGDEETEGNFSFYTDGGDTIKGGKDRDEIYGGFGNDVIDAGDGDNLVAGGMGFDNIQSGSGVDEVWGGNRYDAPSPILGVDVSDDSIFSTGGSDTVHAGGGNDTVEIESGTVYGGYGNDFIRVRSGLNIIYGDAGNDRLVGGSGDDRLEGGDGEDNIEDFAGNNTVYGGNGKDTIYTGAGSDTIYGEGGDDIIDAGDGGNHVYGGLGNDTLKAGNGNNFIYGRLDSPTLLNDTDDDTILVGDGTNVLVGNGGNDTFGYFLPNGLPDVSKPRPNGNNEVWGDDYQRSSSHDGDDKISLGNGNNTVFGGWGSDIISVDSGTNFIYGDYSSRVYGTLPDETPIEESVSDKRDIISASSGLSGGRLYIQGGGGNDKITTNAYDFKIYGGSGKDEIFSDGPGPGSVIYGDLDIEDTPYDDDDNVTVINSAGNFGPNTDIKVYSGGGADKIQILDILTVEVRAGGNHSGQGNEDRVDVTNAGTATVFGDSLFETALDGRDIINVVALSSVILGGGGDDDIAATSNIEFDIRGGSGVDRINVTGSLRGQDFGKVYGDQGASANANDGSDFINIYGPAKVWGTGGNDEIYINNSLGGNSQVYGDTGNDTITVAGGSQNYIYGGDGNDGISTTFGVDTVYGGAGNDDIRTGFNTDTVFGEAGDDTIYGGDGDDHLDGGDGDDIMLGDNGTVMPNPLALGSFNVTLFFGGGNDLLTGGPGDDRLFGGGGNDDLNGNVGGDQLYGNEGIDRLLGGDGDDFIYGGDGDDKLYGEAGNDTLNGEGGIDLIIGASGDDTASGGDGNDEIYGNDGNDTISGNQGDDRIWGSDGNDILSGNEGNDFISGGLGNDTINGGSGDDDLFGGDGTDIVDGEADNDHIVGDAGDDVLQGGDGDDFVYGGAGLDTLRGGIGNDNLDGGDERDSIYGDDGDDSLIAGQGLGDLLDGGAGNDTLLGSDDRPFGIGPFQFVGDVLSGGTDEDRIFGRSGNDNIDGGEGDDWINSGADHDVVVGGLGNDTIYAGIGIGDWIDGQAGDDTIYGSDEGSDQLYGSDGIDTINGQGGDDQIDGGNDDDILDGGSGSDIVSGGIGNDVLRGGVGVNDQLYGNDGDDILYGSDDGADVLSGGLGRDRLLGLGGNDSLDGGDGDDILDGGSGDDTLSGGAGSDVLLGGGNHDVLYGHSITGTGDDNSVDYLYGDFGTDSDEPNSGNDRLFGQGGNDLLYGEGDDDLLDGGGGLSNRLFYGSGEGANPADFVTLTPTPAPMLVSRPSINTAGATLSTLPDIRGFWSQPAGAGGGDGYSRSQTGISDAVIATSSAGVTYTAWVDSRSGNEEIYVARYVPAEAASGGLASGWSELGGSASQGGISNALVSSREPSIAIDNDGNPLVSWTAYQGSQSDIRVAKFDPASGTSGSWIALGNSLASGGISISGIAMQPKVLTTTSGPVVIWLNSSTSESSLISARFDGGAWVSLGGIINSGGGVVTGYDAAVLGNKVTVVWASDSAGINTLGAREYDGTNWNSLGGQTLITSSTTAFEPSVTYFNSQPAVAWRDSSSGFDEVLAQRFDGATWQAIVSGSNSATGVSNTGGRALSPIIRSNNIELVLAYQEDVLARRAGNNSGIVVLRLAGGNFTSVELPRNVASVFVTREADDLQLAFDGNGRAMFGWSAISAISRQAFLLRGPNFANSRLFYADATNSVQSILTANALGPNDAIVITGTVSGFTIDASDAGVSIIGANSANVSGAVTITANDVSLNGLQLTGFVAINNAARVTIQNSTLTAGLQLSDSSDAQVIDNRITGSGIRFMGTNSNSLVTRNNIEGASGVTIDGLSNGQISNNTIKGLVTGLVINQPFTGTISDNDITQSPTGVSYNSAAPLIGNRIHDNGVGIRSAVAGPAAIGVVVGSGRNDIYKNQTGVVLANADLQSQLIRANTLGVTGTGNLGLTTLEKANEINANATGANFAGPIRFNKFGRNQTAITANSNQVIDHNAIYESTLYGVLINGKANVQVVNNTIVSRTGDMVRLTGGSSGVELTNNVLWAEDGYDIYVAPDSATSFFSDYNLLHTSGNGKLVYWFTDYTDILDWQENVNQYDLHSRGRTSVNPNWSDPRFINRATGDLRTFDVVAQQRFTSPTIDSGNPLVDVAEDKSVYQNLLLNPSFESDLANWTVTPSGGIRTSSPAAFLGTKSFDSLSNPTTTLSQTVDLQATGLPLSGKVIVFGSRIRVANETPTDQGSLRLEFLDNSGVVIGTQTERANGISDRWESVGGRVSIPAGTTFARLTFIATRRNGTSNDVYFDSAFLRLVANDVAPDIGAYGNSPGDLSTSRPRIALRTPDLYRDWERDKQLPIRWESFGNTLGSPVRIDLLQDTADGPQILLNIASSVPDTGRFDWIPSSNNINFGTHGLRIQVSLVDRPIALDRSAESFTVPESTNAFYANDGSNAQNTFTTAIGSNRNTGKLPESPKPLPSSLLRIYTVGAGQTIYIDPGTYDLPTRLVNGNVLDVSDDEGFTVTGASISPAILRIQNTTIVAAVFELIDADFTNVSNLVFSGGQYGLLVRGGSSDVTLRNVTTTAAALDGIRIEADSSIAEIDRVRSFNNNRSGISSAGPIGWIHDSTVSGNGSTGFVLVNPSGLRLESSTISNNIGLGIDIANTAGPLATIGNSNLALGLGNQIFGNSKQGIRAGQNVTVVGNTIYSHSSLGSAGIELSSNASAVSNVVFNNDTGIFASGSSASVIGNRAFNNQQAGILVGGSSIVRENTSYSNRRGLELQNSQTGLVENNLVYGNREVGILDSAGNSVANVRKNNTVYQLDSNAVAISSSNSTASYRNNIITTGSGIGLSVDTRSQFNFASDTNLIQVTGTGSVGRWADRDYKTLSDWQSASGRDANSLSVDPLFVNPTGLDNQLGYVSATILGNDDNFHLSSAFGSLRDSSLSPIVTAVAGGYSLPSFPVGVLANDAMTSPAINAGAANDSFVNEPLNNGGFVDLGSYGNSREASRSAAEYVNVLSPSGNQTWFSGRSLPIRWRSQNTSDTVSIELLRSSGGTPVTVATNVANTGSFVWTVPADQVSANDYLIRITRNSGNTPIGVSPAPFSITAPVNIFYVNDGSSSAGDWTTAPGDDANSGLTPSQPKATLAAALAIPTVGPGSIIRVDAGTYNLTTNLIITAASAGVTIEGFYDVSQPTKFTLINRGNTASSSYVMELRNTDNLTLKNLRLSGGYYGIFTSTTSDSDNVTIRDSWIYNNAYNGILLDVTNDNPSIIGNTVFGSKTQAFSGAQQRGIFLNGQNVNVRDNLISDSGDRGLNVVGTGIILGNTIVNNFVGITANNNAGSLVIGNNTVSGNQQIGIQAQGSAVRVIGNQVIGNTGGYQQFGDGQGIGIQASGSIASGNIVADNILGIELSSNGTASDNLVYGNSSRGLSVSTATARGNRVYDNSIGIITNSSSSILNNLVYDNTVSGIDVTGSSVTVENNTVTQPIGNAVRLTGASVSNVTLRNNILVADAGYVVNVASTSQVGFTSDYNLLNLTGTAKPYLWGSTPFNDQSQVVYGLGFESHSVFADPQFVSPAGSDGVRGFSNVATGPAIYSDDSTATRTGTWNMVNNITAYGGSFLTNSIGVGEDSLQWNLSGLTPGQTYSIAVSVPSGASGTISSTLPYLVYDNGKLITQTQASIYASSFSFIEAGVTYRRLGYFTPTGTTLDVRLTDRGTGNTVVAGDVVRLQPVVGNGGSDDDFKVLNGSPAIDAGNPQSYFLAESATSGGSINLGAYGNTVQSAPSSLQTLQVLSPSGFEKLKAGQTVAIGIRSSGLTQTDAVALMNVGGATTGNWLVDRYRTGGSTATVGNTVNTSPVIDPAPASVYQSYARATSGVGQILNYQLPVPNGDYQIRLHFVEPTQTAANARRFDIRLQGMTVQAGFDIFAASGGIRIATVRTFSVTASGGNGIALDLVNLTSTEAVLSAIELWAANPAAPASPTATLDFTTNNGATWSTIASNVPLDRYGQATFDWTVPTLPVGTTQALIRTVSNDSTTISGQSPQAFSIAGSGRSFYINDSSTTGDEFSTTIGDDANLGTTPDNPMKTLSALLTAYKPTSGDVIYVDSGDYLLEKNIVLTAQNAGLRIQGPGTGTALLNRNNTASGNYGIELVNADNIILDRIAVTGGFYGVYASSASDSDNVTISNSKVFNSYAMGIFLDATNDSALIQSNELYGTRSVNLTSQFQGNIYINGRSTNIRGNNSYYVGGGNNGIGIYANSGSPTTPNIIADNTVTYSKYGIEATNATITGNTLTNNFDRGLSLRASAASNNLVTGSAIAVTGIHASGNSQVRDNIVREYSIGIDVSGASLFNNSVENNRDTGIRVGGTSVVTGNIIRNSVTGIAITGSGNTISNNMLDRNSLRGVYSTNGSTGQTQFVNNTIYQPTGSAIELQTFRNYLTLSNNIIWASGDFAVKDTFDSQTDFQSDYNLFYLTGAAKFSNWQAADITNLRDWTYRVGEDSHSLQADPLFVDAANGNFALQATSPAIDAGYPVSSFVNEPNLGGGRINLGHTGNTAQALTITGPTLQFVAPFDRGRLQAGRSTTISFITSQIQGSQPTFTIDVSTDGGSTWTNVASNIPIDSAGRGTVVWNLPENTTLSSQYKLRLRQVQDPAVESILRGTFQIAPAGRDFYVNDDSLVSDSLTTAVGNDDNHGKSPDLPMRTLAALLDAYDLDAGDVVHVDNGTYVALRNIRLRTDDSGVRIEGPASGSATITRDYSLERFNGRLNVGSAADKNYTFELLGADDVTLDRIVITGADYGVYAAQGVDSDQLTISRSQVFDNRWAGIYIDATNGSALVTDSLLYGTPGGLTRDNQQYGFWLQDNNTLVTRNTIRNHANTGVRVIGNMSGNRISENDVFANSVGIQTQTSTGFEVIVGSNLVHDNTTTGIYASSRTTVSANTVSGQITSGAIGIRVESSLNVSDNTVFGNAIGISGSTGFGSLNDNRIYNNTTGVVGTSVWSIARNSIYSNSTGVQLTAGYSGDVSANLIYANTNIGLLINATGNAPNRQIAGNSIYHTVGNAIQLSGSARNTTLSNNIIQVQAGSAISVAADSQTGFVSNNNLIYPSTSSGNVGTWGGVARPTLAAWQTASSQDANSLSVDPLWADIDGADNILGYAQVGGVFADGGVDDNFSLQRLSLAIDRGTGTRLLDRYGRATSDDLGTPNQPGILDLGAIEFLGSSLDVTPPSIVSTNPVAVQTGGIQLAAINRIDVTFNEPINPIDVNSAALFELLGDGGDAVFGNTNDSVYPVSTLYDSNTNTLRLTLQNDQVLGTGRYQLTIRSSSSAGLRDYAGWFLDGDADGVAGGNFVGTFQMVVNSSPTITGPLAFPNIDEDASALTSGGRLVSSIIAGAFSDVDGPHSGLAITAADDTFGVWQYSLDSVAWLPIATQLASGNILLLAADANTKLRFIPLPNFFGNAGNIVVRAWDQAEGLPTGTSILPAAIVTNSLGQSVVPLSQLVNPINDPPSFTVLNNPPLVNEDAGQVELTGFLADISPGAGELDPLNFFVDQNSNPALFETQPTVSAAGQLRFVTKADAHGSSVVSLRLFDGDLSSDVRTFTITISPVNDAPTAISITNSSIRENLAAGATVAQISSLDIDQGDSHTYQLVSGPGDSDNTSFTIVGNELRTTRKFDFEASPTLSVRLRATDLQGASVEQVFTINVVDLLEIESITIGDGTLQRSQVNQVRILLDGIADIDSGAFVVRQRGANGGVVPTTAIVSDDTIPGKTLITLLFDSSPFVEVTGSLKDGNYDLMIDGNLIRRVGTPLGTNLLDADRDGIDGGMRYFGRTAGDQIVAADAFFRMLGDTDGDRDVDAQDFAKFSVTYRKTNASALYDAAFDSDSDGDVDAQDYAAFSVRYRKTLPLQ